MNIYLKKKHLILLSTLSGLLLTFGWPANGFPFFLFLGFVPLLFIEDYIYNNKTRFNRFSFFGYTVISMIVWNSLTTYWIYFSTAFGGIAAVLLNTILMSLTLSLFHYSRKVLKHNSAYLVFIIFWISFEYFHLHWDLSWPWMNLGNGFANYPSLIQWYEYTGTFGGTLWILLTNYIIFRTIKLFINKEKTVRYRTFFAAFCSDLILVPVIISLFIYYTHKDKGILSNVVVVQPNIDPYNEKFGGMTSEQQLAKLLNLAKQKTDKNTNLLIGPETAIPQGVWENFPEDSRNIDSLKNYIKKYPQLNILMGLSSYRMYLKDERISITARRSEQGWYDAYNAAIMIDTSNKYQFYHKSRLVPGVEKMPYPTIFKSLEKFALDLGGMSGSLGTQDERSVLYSIDSIIKAAPVICYESIYGEYVSEYINNGANLICIITNDGWWKDTPGYRQHCCYASLRAIETRKSIARSANTGISCFVNQRGDIMQATKWDENDVIKQMVLLNDEQTFYSKYGDYIAKTSLFMSALIFPYILFISISRRFRRKIKES